ncbi:hypothetical protein BD769DRAFT_1300635, partial [Suillus cothurnatus]
SPDQVRLASASGDGTLKIWNVKIGQLLWSQLHAHAGEINLLAISPDGGLIAIATTDHT